MQETDDDLRRSADMRYESWGGKETMITTIEMKGVKKDRKRTVMNQISISSSWNGATKSTLITIRKMMREKRIRERERDERDGKRWEWVTWNIIMWSIRRKVDGIEVDSRFSQNCPLRPGGQRHRILIFSPVMVDIFSSIHVPPASHSISRQELKRTNSLAIFPSDKKRVKEKKGKIQDKKKNGPGWCWEWFERSWWWRRWMESRGVEWSQSWVLNMRREKIPIDDDG